MKYILTCESKKLFTDQDTQLIRSYDTLAQATEAYENTKKDASIVKSNLALVLEEHIVSEEVVAERPVSDKLPFIHQDKRPSINGWILDFGYLKNIQEEVQKKNSDLSLEDIETALLVATGNGELLK